MSKTSDIVLVNLSGADKPGVTSSITAIFAEYEVNILDIGQAVIHDALSLGFLIEIPPAAETSPGVMLPRTRTGSTRSPSGRRRPVS